MGRRGRLAERRGAEKREGVFFGVRLWRLVGVTARSRHSLGGGAEGRWGDWQKEGGQKKGKVFFGVRLWRLVGVTARSRHSLGGGRGERGRFNIELQDECGGGGAFLE